MHLTDLVLTVLIVLFQVGLNHLDCGTETAIEMIGDSIGDPVGLLHGFEGEELQASIEVALEISGVYLKEGEVPENL